MADNKNTEHNISHTTYLDPYRVQFRWLREAYDKHHKDTVLNEDNKDHKEQFDNYYDNENLALAEIWVDAYSKATGLANPGLIAFDSHINGKDFQTAMDIAQRMRGKDVEEFVDVLTAALGHQNSTAIETILYFVTDPKIANVFHIYNYDDTAYHIAEHKKDNLLETHSEQELKQIYTNFQYSSNGIPTPAPAKEKKQEDQKIDDEQEAPKLTTIPVERPSLKVQDFNPNILSLILDRIDYDGKNVIVLDPDLIEEIGADNIPKLAPQAMLARLWRYTCFDMEPNASPDRIAEIDNGAFYGNNAVVLACIFDYLFNGKSNNIDVILTSVAQLSEAQNDTSLVLKAYTFLMAAAQHGDLNLDFSGLRDKSFYEQLTNPEMEQEDNFVMTMKRPNNYN